MDALLAIVSDGVRYPGVFSLFGCMAVALYISVQVARSAIQGRYLSTMVSPIWSPIVVTAFLTCMVALDQWRAGLLA